MYNDLYKRKIQYSINYREHLSTKLQDFLMQKSYITSFSTIVKFSWLFQYRRSLCQGRYIQPLLTSSRQNKVVLTWFRCSYGQPRFYLLHCTATLNICHNQVNSKKTDVLGIWWREDECAWKIVKKDRKLQSTKNLHAATCKSITKCL